MDPNCINSSICVRWKCSLCGEICANLAVHVGRNHADQTFQCGQCEVHVGSEYLLKAGLRIRSIFGRILQIRILKPDPGSGSCTFFLSRIFFGWFMTKKN